MYKCNKIISAYKRIIPYIRETPVYTSSTLNDCLGKNTINFKMENLQKTGSFKVRGALNCLLSHYDKYKQNDTVVAVSSGNHAQAVAWAAKSFRLKSIIFVPKNISKIKLKATKSYSSQVIICQSRLEAEERALQTSLQKGFFLIPPYNDYNVIAGQGTILLEVINKKIEFDSVFAPCGGGGLLSGLIEASYLSRKKINIFGVEPKKANDAFLSLKNNKIYKFKKTPNTIADGARTLALGEKTFPYIKKLRELYLAEESEIIYWTQWLSHLLNTQIEPTSGMTMVGVCKWLAIQSQPQNVLVVVSGGNVDKETLQNIWKYDLLKVAPSL